MIMVVDPEEALSSILVCSSDSTDFFVMGLCLVIGLSEANGLFFDIGLCAAIGLPDDKRSFR